MEKDDDSIRWKQERPSNSTLVTVHFMDEIQISETEAPIELLSTASSTWIVLQHTLQFLQLEKNPKNQLSKKVLICFSKLLELLLKYLEIPSTHQVFHIEEVTWNRNLQAIQTLTNLSCSAA